MTTTPIPPQPISIVILAGGRGERIGADKALLMLEGLPLAQRSINTLAALSDDIICVARADQRLAITGARLVNDPLEAVGVLPAMLAGLEVARYDWTLVVACDMPFVQLPLVAYMRAHIPDCDVVVPQLQVGLEPLHAFYCRSVVPALCRVIDQGKRRVISFYEGLHICCLEEKEIRRVDPHLTSFFNINTDEDLQAARQWIENGQQGPVGVPQEAPR